MKDNKNLISRRLPMTCSLLLLAGITCLQAQPGPTLTTIYTFTGGVDRDSPNGGLALGTGGVLYGTNLEGTIFGLTPPASPGGAWTFNILYQLLGGSDGYLPESGVAIGAGGVLYGTTAGGGSSNGGTVYSLAPPSSPGGAWTHTVLYSFTGADGWSPTAAPVIAGHGVLYGTTSQGGINNGGVVYSLSPPVIVGGAWTETVLQDMVVPGGRTPSAGLTLSGRVLYGTTSLDPGTVFSMTPPAAEGDAWAYATIFTFTCSTGGFCDGAGPASNLTVGAGGVLYGSTSYPGYGYCDVFSLTPPSSPGGAWTETVLQSFRQSSHGGVEPFGNMAFDPQTGALFLTGTGGVSGGMAEELLPPASPGGTWTQRRLHTFTGGSDGAVPLGLIRNGNVLYGVTSEGGGGNCSTGCGTIYELKP